MMQPRVSVVVPIYNVERYLNRCVESIVRQSYTNLEIILVDDGSPDKCPSMCDAWAERDRRILVIHKKNAGLGMARNSGVDAATGKYICFFDSDDYVDHRTIEKCVISAEKHDSDVVIFGRCDVNEFGQVVCKPISTEKCLFQGEELLNELLPGMFTYDRGFGVSACGTLFRLGMFKENDMRFHSEREIISEDAYFALEFYGKAKTVTVVPENLYFYFCRTVSLSRRYREDRQEKNDYFLKKSLAYIEEKGLPRVVATHLTARYHFYTIAALKQIMETDLEEEEKKKAVMKVLDSTILQSSLVWEVLRLEKNSLKLFFCALKLRAKWICYVLLKYKMQCALR